MSDHYFLPERQFSKLYVGKNRNVSSLKNEDIPGCKPKKTTYEKSEIVRKYNDRLIEKQQKDLQQYNSNSLNYWQFPHHMQNPKVLFESKDAHRSTPNLLSERIETYGSYRPVPNIQVSSLFSPRNFMYTYDPKMADALYLDFDTTKNEKPTKNSTQARENIFIRDSLDALKTEVEGKSQSSNNAYYEQPSYEAPLNRERKSNYQEGGTTNLQSELSKNYGQFIRNQDKPEKPSLTLKHSRSDYIVFNPLTQSPMMRYQNSPKHIELPKVRTVGEEWKFQTNASKFFT
jgi:hypothetical protein